MEPCTTTSTTTSKKRKRTCVLGYNLHNKLNVSQMYGEPLNWNALFHETQVRKGAAYTKAKFQDDILNILKEHSNIDACMKKLPYKALEALEEYVRDSPVNVQMAAEPIMPDDSHDSCTGKFSCRYTDRFPWVKKKLEDFKLLERAKGFDQFKAVIEKKIDFTWTTINALMLRRIKLDVKHELHFQIGSTACLFGEMEFALMTGLYFTDMPAQSKDLGVSRLARKYFSTKNQIKCKDLYAVVDAWNDTDNEEDLFKLILCSLVVGVILAYEKSAVIYPRILHMVDDLDTFTKYPWGRESFELTLDSLLEEEPVHVTHQLKGFPGAILFWAYEAIRKYGNLDPAAKEKFPRMLKWETVPRTLAICNYEINKNPTVFAFLEPEGQSELDFIGMMKFSPATVKLHSLPNTYIFRGKKAKEAVPVAKKRRRLRHFFLGVDQNDVKESTTEQSILLFRGVDQNYVKDSQLRVSSSIIDEKMKSAVDNEVFLNKDDDDVLIVPLRGFDITRKCLKCLKPGGWLNDQVVCVYFDLLKKKEEEKRCNQVELPLRCHYCDTMFYTKLIGNETKNKGPFSAKEKYSFVRRWNKDFDYKISDCDMVFVPVHKGKEKHWCLGIIDVKQKRIWCYDSLHSDNDDVSKNLAEYYAEETSQKCVDKDKRVKEVMSWSREPMPGPLPAQENGCVHLKFIFISPKISQDELVL